MLKSTKGKIAEYRFISELLKRGYEVFIPAIEGTKTDILICKDKKFERVQVKCTETANGETIQVKCCSENSRGMTTYTLEDFDYMCVLDLVNDTGYLIPVELVAGKQELTLRLSPPKISNPNIHYASDFQYF